MRCSTHTSVHQPPTEVLRTLFVKLSWMCWHGRILEEAPGNYPLGGSESRNRSMPHLYTWRHRYIYFEPSLARLDPLYAVITESHTEIQEKLSHVPVGLRAYSYLFWLTDSNTKVYGLHALMFTTETTANHRIHRGRSESPLIMTAIMSFMYYKAHKVKAELRSKATQEASKVYFEYLSAPAPGRTLRDDKISFEILLWVWIIDKPAW